MSKLPQQKHDDAIADVIWWLKGYSAASEPNHDVDAMLCNLRHLRTWLDRLGESGRAQPARVLGTDPYSIRIVLTEAEFDKINDGLMDYQDECENAKELMGAIRKEYTAEMQQDEIPF